MTKDEKLYFVADLCHTIQHDVMQKIASDAIPKDWGGAELRQLLADKFKEQTVPNTLCRREYENTVIVNNL
jgi:hypothetical protein